MIKDLNTLSPKKDKIDIQNAYENTFNSTGNYKINTTHMHKKILFTVLEQI